MRRVGRALTHTSHQINRALDACIGETVSQELTGMRGMVLGYIVRTTRSGRPVYQRDLEHCFRVQLLDKLLQNAKAVQSDPHIE